MADTGELVLQVALPLPLRRSFDYLPPEDAGFPVPKPGIRVRVPFGGRERTGLLIGTTPDSELDRGRLKRATAVLDREPLFTPGQLALLEWASGYYQHPLGEVVFNALPPGLRAGKPAVVRGKDAAGKDLQPGEQTLQTVSLNPGQRNASEQIRAALPGYAAFLLYGVTGSGKTEVYLELIRRAIAEGGQALLLVPEIGLTPQLISRVKERLCCRLAVIHSALSSSERNTAWLQARSGEAQLVLGTRSAVWTPLHRPGIIVVDEEHDASYKQQDGFRYSARDVAVMRARNENVPVVLGSATPSMESLQNVRAGRFTELRLPERAVSAAHPQVEVVDLRGRPMTGALSKPLLEAVGSVLEEGRQSLLFLNRRGFSPVIMCHACGWIATCSRCEVPMTYHKQREALVCHHCGRSAAGTRKCPQCGAEELFRIGHGTQRLEETLAERFPEARILRIDRDSTRRKGAMDEMVSRINAGDADILVGTQMLAKGHDFPNLALVGIIDADRGLFSADFRATERMAQLFIQVSGRAGRSAQRGKVVIQTHFPAHPLLESLIRTGYESFAEAVLEERRQAELPPFSFLALVRAEDYEPDRPRKFLEQARELLVKQETGVLVFGPVPAPMEKRAGRSRFQLLVQAQRRPLLAKAIGPWVHELESLPSGKRVRWSLDVDPQDIL